MPCRIFFNSNNGVPVQRPWELYLYLTTTKTIILRKIYLTFAEKKPSDDVRKNVEEKMILVNSSEYYKQRNLWSAYTFTKKNISNSIKIYCDWECLVFYFRMCVCFVSKKMPLVKTVQNLFDNNFSAFWHV